MRGSRVTDGLLILQDVDEEILDRFVGMCERRRAMPEKMFETMVRSFDRTPAYYGLHARLDFGKYAGMIIEDVVHTDPRYLRWLNNTSAWFKLQNDALALLATIQD